MQLLNAVHQLENMLKILTDLGLVKSPEQKETADKPNIQVQAFITRLNGNEEIEYEKIDNLVKEIQEFIGSLNKLQNLSRRATDFESCKYDCTRLRNMHNKLRNTLMEEKVNQEIAYLEHAITQANDREKKLQHQMTSVLDNSRDMQHSDSSCLMQILSTYASKFSLTKRSLSNSASNSMRR